MPVDPEPVDSGNVRLEEATDGSEDVFASYAAAAERSFGDDGTRYVSHFATCPFANQHRRGTA